MRTFSRQLPLGAQDKQLFSFPAVKHPKFPPDRQNVVSDVRNPIVKLSRQGFQKPLGEERRVKLPAKATLDT